MKTTTRRNTDGTPVRYLHLAHNEWDPTAGRSVPKILHSFGREDHLDRPALTRLVACLSKLLDPADALTATAGSELAFVESRPYGGAYVLDALWRRLHLDTIVGNLLQGPRGRPRDPAAERVLFALVANRALAPSSKLAAADWVTHDVHLPGLPATDDDACYRAMDWLHQVTDTLEQEVFWSVATLLDLEVDLLFFDTTSTYFELDEPDEPLARDTHGRVRDTDPPSDGDGDGDGDGKMAGFRTYGKSKDHRPDLPQVVIGMAVTRTGIPVRVWCWPGNTGDSALIRQVKADMRDWTLARVVWVADRGFASEANRRYLRSGDHHYIIGEKLRCGSAEAKLALSRQGRYQQVADNLRVKEVRISEHERFIICHNPDAADRDAATRTRLLTQLDELIADSDKLSKTKRAELRGVISTKPGLNRYLRVTGSGLLRVDAKAIKTETNLDGHLSAEDIAVGYKQLLEVERGWRDMKQVIDLRPVYHRLEERIRAHVTLCWLALLLVRIIETTTGKTWPAIRGELQRLHVGTFTGPAGVFRRRTELTKPHRDILTKLQLTAPKPIIELATPAEASPQPSKGFVTQPGHETTEPRNERVS